MKHYLYRCGNFSLAGAINNKSMMIPNETKRTISMSLGCYITLRNEPKRIIFTSGRLKPLQVTSRNII